MPTCSLPLLERHFLPTIGGALLLAVLAGMIGHSILRTFLEARGVAPWGILDSLSSMPLVLIGAASVGASAALTAGLVTLPCTDTSDASIAVAIIIMLAVGGLLMLRLGLLALRKLT